MIEIIGYIASIFIGLVLGLIGSGGSILAVPIMVYLFGVNAVAATAYSLFIVSITAAIGTYKYNKRGMVKVRTALLFGIASTISVVITRGFVVPLIPQQVFSFGDFVMTKDMSLLILFATLMVISAYKMIKPIKLSELEQNMTVKFSYATIFIYGWLVGMVTGLVGAGGGFIMVPVFLLLFKLSMKEAVGTSLLIMTINAVTGFLSSLKSTYVDWTLILSMSFFAVIGIFIGLSLAKKMDGKKLKPIFGWFVLTMGVYIIAKELLFR